MRNNKNNITSGLENIISFSRNITSHFTGKEKIITLVLIIIILSFANMTSCFLNSSDASALNYQSNVGVSFTFNPTLSINISSSDLTISNLTPGTTSDGNAINVSVATNAAYGYTLSAIMNGDNSNLTHTNGANAFSSIATDASLSNLATDNTWGYSYKNNLASTPTWSNYSGLSNEVGKVLFNTDSNTNGSIDFKIAAKASDTQPSGAYTGTINFTATTKLMPKTIDDIAYMQTFAELDAVDLVSVKSSMALNSAYILKDIRDEKEYYVTRLEDGNVWMTQNLDLDISHDRPLTSNDTDLNDSTSAAYQDGYTIESDVVYWTPNSAANTANFEGTSVNDWSSAYSAPRSASKTDDTGIGYSSLGNYYNWTAAIASNNSSSLTQNTLNNITNNPKNSICPKGWRLPIIATYEDGELGNNDFYNLKYYYNPSDNTGHFLADSPLYFVYGGLIVNKGLVSINSRGVYWSNTPNSSNNAYALSFDNNSVNFSSPGTNSRHGYFSVRCLAR